MPTIIPATGARYFSKGFNDGKAAPAFQYIFDSGVVWQGDNGLITTGAMRPVIPSDLAGVSNISVSGLSLSVGAVALTGTSVVTTTGNQPVSVVNTAPIPFSGVTQVGNTAPIPFSGVVQVGNTVTANAAITNAVLATSGISTIGNTAPIPVSGVVQANVTVVDTGNRNVLVVNTAPIAVSGVVVTSATIGNVAITGFTSTIAPLAVSGTFNATTDNTTVVLALASGNNLATTANQLLSGISGSLANNLSAAAWVTGQIQLTGNLPVSVVNTAPIAISGIVQSSAAALQAVSGNATIINTAPIPMSGVVQANVTNTVTTNATVTNALLAVSGNATVINTAPIPFSGMVQIGNTVTTNATIANALLAVSGNTITQITGFNTGIVVSIQPVTKTAVSNSTPSGVSPWTSMSAMQTGLLGTNANRVMFFVQNIHTGIPLVVALNSSPASTGNFNFILNPSAAAGYGGSSFSDDHYRGPVQISGGAYISWEL